MTISTLLSLQHTSTIVLNNESSAAGHLTDLAGYFQTTLQQQIVAADIDENAGAVVVDQTLDLGAKNAILGSGEELPGIGTELPDVQTTPASWSAASFTGQIRSGKQALSSASNSLPFSARQIASAEQLVGQYAGNQTAAQNVSFGTTSTEASIAVPQRSASVQYAAPTSTATITPEVEAALKLAERNGVLFESSLRAPAKLSELNSQQAFQTATSTNAQLVSGPLNSEPLATGALARTQNLIAAQATAAGAQAPAVLTDLPRGLGLNSLAGSSIVTDTINQSGHANQTDPAIKVTETGKQGMGLAAQFLSQHNDNTESVSGRSRQAGTILTPPVDEQRVLPPGFLEHRVSDRLTEATRLSPVNLPGVQDVTAGRLTNTEAEPIEALRDKFVELNNNKALLANHKAINAQHSSTTLKAADQAFIDPASILNRQALNAETFRNTIKTAVERGLGRQQDSAIRSDHSSIGDTRPIDGDNGRTISLPSVSGTQALSAQAASTASALSGAQLDTAAGQADAAAKLGQRIQWMVNANARRADIQIDPPELGSVQIQVSQEDRQTTVSFVTQNASARELIEQSLPRLREHLENLGIELADANVEQQSAGHADSEEGKTDAVASSANDEAKVSDESVDETSRPSNNQRDGGIDAYA